MTSMRDVATRAAVSVATVSRVLSDEGYPVRRETRQKVLAAAEDLGYQHNALAQSLRQGRANSVGVCATVLSSLTAMSTVEGISETLTGYGRNTQVTLTRWEAARERAALELFSTERVAGVIAFPSEAEQEGYRRLQASGVPVVLINRSVAGVPAPVIRHDFAGGYRLAVETLAATGHRRIAAVLPSSADASGNPVSRTEHGIAWDAAVERLGLEPRPDWRLPGSDALDVGRLRGELAALLTGPNRPTALFCGLVPDTLATLRILADLGLRVPEDIAVVGTADERWRPLIGEEIPVLVLDSYQLGVTAARLLDDAITTGRATADTEVVLGVGLDAGTDRHALE